MSALHDEDRSSPELGSLPSGWDAIDVAIGDRLRAGLIVPADFPEPYGRYESERLIDIWRNGRPEIEELVVCHGRPVLGSFHVDHGEVVAMGDLGGMRHADRHLDLAIVHQSLHSVLGPDAVFMFYDAYGLDPNLVLLDHYILGALLLEGPIWS